MAQWQQIQQSATCRRRITELYPHFFPLEARHYFAEWLEGQPWSEVNPDNGQDAHKARAVFEAFTAIVDEKVTECSQLGDFLKGHQLETISSQLRSRYKGNELEFVRTVRHCLAMEKSFLPEDLTSLKQASELNESHAIIDRTLHHISLALLEIENEKKELQAKQDLVVIHTQELWTIRSKLSITSSDGLSTPTSPPSQDAFAVGVGDQSLNRRALIREQNDMEKVLMKEAEELVSGRKSIYEKLENVLTSCATVQTLVLDNELMQWQYQQQLHRAGRCAQPGPLDRIEGWCQALAEIVLLSRRLVQLMQHMKSHVPVTNTPDLELEGLSEKCELLVYQLVTRSFVVEQQPSQIVKIQTCFAATVRLLAGGRLPLHMNPIEVHAHLISEKQAQKLATETTTTHLHVGREIKNNTRVMEYRRGTETMSAEFKKMVLPNRPRRSPRPGGEPQVAVTDEKFCILFTAKVSMGSGDMLYTVRTISLPLVIVIHISQNTAAEATLMWDNAFAEPGRLPFAVPEAVSWGQMAQALSDRFQMITGRGLETRHRSMLFSKIFPAMKESPDVQFSWGKLNKEQLLYHKCTFWEWFHSISEMVKRYTLHEWNDGLIEGFITKEQAEEFLTVNPVKGAFVIRFSREECALAVMYTSVINGQYCIRQLRLGQRDFTVLSLADRMQSHDQLQFLRRLVELQRVDSHKDEVFGNYYSSKVVEPDEGKGIYVGHKLVSVLMDEEQVATSNVESDRSSTSSSSPPPSVSASSVVPSSPFSVSSHLPISPQMAVSSMAPVLDEQTVAQYNCGLPLAHILSEDQTDSFCQLALDFEQHSVPMLSDKT